MSDSLRDRIAAVLYRVDHDWSLDGNLHEDMADAVIAELGLKREGTDPEQIIGHGYPPLHRYVTDWKADDE